MRPFGCISAGGFARVLVSALAVVGLTIGSPIESAGAETFQPGDVFVGVANGKVQWYRPDPLSLTGVTLISTLDTQLGGFTTGMAFDAAGNLYVTNFGADAVSKFDMTGGLIGTFGSGYHCSPESIVFDAAGNAYVGQADCSRDILKFNAAGNLLERFNVATEGRGSDWIDLAPKGCTALYTSEAKSIKRFDLATKSPLPDFNAAALPGLKAYALAVLPDGGLLVGDTEQIVRLGNLGNQIQTYDAPGQDFWFAVSLDPTDLTVFWAADQSTGTVFKFSLADGSLILQFPTGTGPFTVAGLAVFGPATPKGEGCAAPPPLAGQGRMTGGGSVFTSSGMRFTHGFELHCDPSQPPNNLEVNWGSGNKFRLESIITASCVNAPGISPKPPAAGFNTYIGTGVGRYNGVPGTTIEFTFTDAGEPGTNDTADLKITGIGGSPVLSVSGKLDKGDQQAHKN